MIESHNLFFYVLWYLFTFLLLGGVLCPQSTSSDKEPIEPKNGVFEQLNGWERRLKKLTRELDVKAEQLDAKEKQLKQLQSNKSKYQGKLSRLKQTEDENVPIIYIITPTYVRDVQKAELTRLVQTFLHINNLHWILIEDSDHQTSLVTNLLKLSGLSSYTHLNELTPAKHKVAESDPNWLKPRGVLQRNKGLKWLRDNTDTNNKDVVYFADDDNTYDIRIFDEVGHKKQINAMIKILVDIKIFYLTQCMCICI